MVIPIITIKPNEIPGDYYLKIENWETRNKYTYPISIRKCNKFSRYMAFIDEDDVEKNYYLIYIFEYLRRKYDSYIQIVNTFHYDKILIFSSYTHQIFKSFEELPNIKINFNIDRINVYKRLIKSWLHKRFRRTNNLIRNEKIDGLIDLPILSHKIKPIIKTFMFNENLHKNDEIMDEYRLNLNDSTIIFKVHPTDNFYYIEPKLNFRSISPIEISKEIFLKKFSDYFHSKRKRNMSKHDFIMNYKFIIYQ